MFTGIITDVGRIRRVDHVGDEAHDRCFEIGTAYDVGSIAIGASIACSGVCLTVIETGPGWFAVQASNETLGCTTLDNWEIDTAVNLERALKVGDELGGHIVSGHVDGVGTISEIRRDAESHRYKVTAPPTLGRLIAPKGSITIEGVSLTVNGVDGNHFDVNIIPHTLAVTTIGHLREGDRVNLEVDMLARYVARLLGNTVSQE